MLPRRQVAAEMACGWTTIGMPFPWALVGLDSIVGAVLMKCRSHSLNVNRIPDFLEESVKAAPPHALTTAFRIMSRRQHGILAGAEASRRNRRCQFRRYFRPAAFPPRRPARATVPFLHSLVSMSFIFGLWRHFLQGGCSRTL